MVLGLQEVVQNLSLLSSFMTKEYVLQFFHALLREAGVRASWLYNILNVIKVGWPFEIHTLGLATCLLLFSASP